MTVDTVSPSPTQLLKGRISNLRKTRRSQDFLFTDADREKMGATAIAAGLAGLGGIAVGLSGMAMDTTEEADLLEFDLDSKPIKAWVWYSVFNEGDEVEVVAEQWGDTWQGYGIRRPGDSIVALHPHCSRGRFAHYRKALKLWISVSAAFLFVSYFICVLMMYMNSINKWDDFVVVGSLAGLACLGITLLITLRISKKFMGFVHLAEGVFQGFGWKDVKNIDLPAITKKSKNQDDPGALGILYFRY